MRHTYGVLPLLRERGVIYGEHPARRARLDHLPRALPVESHRIPVGIRQQVLKPFDGRAGHRRGDPIAGLAWEVGEKPCAVALEALAGRCTTKKRHERFKEGSQTRKRSG